MGSTVIALSIAVILTAAVERFPTINGAKLDLRQETCANGNAKLAADGTPYLFWDDKWFPICGHYFWNDNHGVDAFCRELGFTTGSRKISNANYGEDAIKVGACRAGEDIRSCTREQNFYRVDSDCKPGTGNNAFTITCAGNPKGTELNSCPASPPTTTATTTEESVGCQDTNVLCKMEPAFLLDILCQIESVSEQCPNRCNSCPEIEATTTSTTTTTTTTTTTSSYPAFNEGDYSYCFANCNGGVQNAAPDGGNDGNIVYGDFSCNEEMGGLYAPSSGSQRHIVLPLKGGSSIEGPKTVAVLVKHGAGSEGKVPREFRLWRSMILNSEPFPRARAEFPQCGSKKFLGPINNMFSQTEFVLMVLRSGEQGTAMFRNGIKVASNDCTTPIPASDRMWLGANHFKGTFKSFAMWNRELSDDEVASLDPTKLTC